VSQPTSVPIAAPSSSLRLSETRSKLLERKQHTSSLDRLGRTGIAIASTGGCAPLMHVNMHCRAVDELLNGEIFYSLREAPIIIERWRSHYNTKRPHSALGYCPPAQKKASRLQCGPYDRHLKQLAWKNLVSQCAPQSSVLKMQKKATILQYWYIDAQFLNRQRIANRCGTILDLIETQRPVCCTIRVRAGLRRKSFDVQTRNHRLCRPLSRQPHAR